MKKVAKGTYGYIKDQKKRRILMTVIAFAIPMIIYLTGYFQTGTRNNLLTVVAVLGCLPASKVAVGMIMMLMQKSMEPSLYEEIRTHVKDMTALYETTVSAYEKNMPMPCIVVSGLNVVCYSADAKVDAPFAEKHIKKILQGNGYRSNVKVFTDLKLFLRRVDELYANREEWEASVPFRPDERYPDATRNELVKQVILCICL